MTGELCVTIWPPGEGASREYVFPHPFALIGSSPESNIKLPATDLSGRSLLLCATGDRIIPVEFDSSTGSRPVGPFSLRQDGPPVSSDPTQAKLHMGPFRISAHWIGSDGRRVGLGDVVSLSQNSPSQDVGFRFLNAVSRKKQSAIRHLREKVTLVGRSSPCHVKLSDSRVAPVQCTVTRIGQRILLEDLNRNGVLRLNGAEVGVAYLAEGDELAVGRFRMRLWSREPLTPDDSSGDQDRELQRMLESLFNMAPTEGGPQPPLSQLLTAAPNVALPATIGERALQRNPEPGSPSWSMMSAIERLVCAQQQMVDESRKQTQLFEGLVSLLAQNHRDVIQQDLKRSEMIAAEIQQLRKQLPQGGFPGGMIPMGPAPFALMGVGDPLGTKEPDQSRKASDTRVHSAIELRIEALEQERNSCLKRALRYLTGKDA